jgi:hypothetical protein
MTIVIDKWGSEQTPDDSGGGIVIDRWGSNRVTLGDVGAQAWKDIKAVPGKVLDAATKVLQLPSRVGEAVTEYEQTGEYNPAPFMETALLASPVNPAVRGGDRMIPGMARNTRPADPLTATQLNALGKEGFDQAKQMGVEIHPGALKLMADKLERDLFNKGIHEEHAPLAFASLKRLQNPGVAPDGSRMFATVQDIHNVRQAFGNAAASHAAPKDSLAGTMGIEALDNFISNPPRAAVLAGPAAEAGGVLKDAIGNYAAARRGNAITGELDKAITGIGERAELNAAAANSGANVGNSIRQGVKSFLKSETATRGFTEEELAQALRVSEGTNAMNATRKAANVVGGGGGLGRLVTTSLGAGGGAAAGSAIGNPVAGAMIGGAAGYIPGEILKAAENALTKRELQKFLDAVLKRSPGYQNLPPMPTDPVSRKVIMKALGLEALEQPEN